MGCRRLKGGKAFPLKQWLLITTDSKLVCKCNARILLYIFNQKGLQNQCDDVNIFKKIVHADVKEK